MNKNILIALLLVIVLVFAGYSVNLNRQTQQVSPKMTPVQAVTPSPTPTPQAIQPGNSIVIALAQENNSGETGTATLTENNGKVDVILALAGQTDATPQPAHIHIGDCPGVGAVKYPLTAVIHGLSKTTITVSLSDLLKQLPLAINVHKSSQEVGIYTACGRISDMSVSSTVFSSPAVVSPTSSSSITGY